MGMMITPYRFASGGVGGGVGVRQFVSPSGTAVSATSSRQYVEPRGAAIKETE